MEPLLKKILHYISIENTKQLFNCIKPDFSNIDEVYINNLNVWYCNISDIRPTTKDGKGIEIINGILLNPENVIISKTKEGFELTEIDFINSELKSFEFLEFDKLNLIEQKQFEYYKDYLNNKKKYTEWTSDDYYNRYIETKQFYNFPARIYKRYQYTEINDRLNRIAKHFNYILNKLQPEDKQEFISYYKSDLTNLRNKQTQIEFIDLINGFIQAINKPPQQVENVKPDEVKKELYNHIFKDNAFEVFEKYHTTKNLAENCKTDLNLLFQLFKKDNLFLETVELKHYIKWLNSTYNYSLIELKRVDIKTRPNIQRTNDYKEYKKSTLNKP